MEEKKNQIDTVIALTIYDKKAQLYSEPFYCPTVAAGLRLIEDFCTRNPAHCWTVHKEDYEIFQISSTFNRITGKFYDTQDCKLQHLTALDTLFENVARA